MRKQRRRRRSRRDCDFFWPSELDEESFQTRVGQSEVDEAWKKVMGFMSAEADAEGTLSFQYGMTIAMRNVGDGNVLLGVRQLKRRWYEHMFFKKLAMSDDHAQQTAENFDQYVRRSAEEMERRHILSGRLVRVDF